MSEEGTAPRASRSGRWVSLAVVIATAALVVYKVRIAISVGPGWDTYAFLSNAAEFAGRGYGYAELHRPPLMSFLTALAFRAGAPMHESVIQWIDGIVSATGILALFFLTRRRVGPWLAASAAVLAFAVQPLWEYLGSGYTDFPSVAISMWLLLACIKATEDDPRFYIPAGVLFVAAVLTRYTALLAAFPALVWIIMRWHPFRQAKTLAVAAAAAIAAYLPAASYYMQRFGDALFPFILAFGVSEEVSAPGGEGSATASALWYIRRLPSFLAPGSSTLWAWAAILIAVIGLALAIGMHLQESRPGFSGAFLALAGIAVALAAQFGGAGMVARQLSIPIAVVAIWRGLASVESPGGRRRVAAPAALDAAMLAWLLAYFDFHGHQSIQVPRYVITVVPPLAYFIALGWRTFAADIRHTLVPRAREDAPGIRPERWAALGLAVLVGVLVVGTAGATPRVPDKYVAAARDTADWLKRQQIDETTVVYSDLWPLTAWYATTAARPMPFFKQTDAFAHELDKNDADYYVTIRSRRYDRFSKAYSSGSAVVLASSDVPPPVLPRILYIGHAWDNYLEQVAGFRFYLDSDSGRYGWEGTAFLDAFTADELSRYDVVAVSDVRWRDRAAGETALAEYVKRGGTVVFDGSANLGELPYEMADTVAFDTVIRRRRMSKNANIVVSDAFLASHRNLTRITTAPFVNEDGGPWYGADYEPLPGTEAATMLATADGRPVVALKRFGKGQVYFIGYNLVWHAFLGGSPSESALVSAVFADALESR